MEVKPPTPPRWALWLLRWYCHPAWQESLEGDLYEYFHQRLTHRSLRAARWLFVWDVVRHCRPFLMRAPQQLFSPNRFPMLPNSIKIAWRHVRHHRVVSLLNGLGMLISLASALFIFTWVRHELSYDTFHQKADRIYRITNTFTSASESFTQAISGPALGKHLPEMLTPVEAGTRVVGSTAQLQYNDRRFFEREITAVDPAFFQIFDFELIQGDTATVLAEPQSIVLTPELATRYFGEEDPVGKTVRIHDAYDLKVTGIVAPAPANSQIQFSALLPMDFIKLAFNFEGMDDMWIGGMANTYLLTDPNLSILELEDLVNNRVGEMSGEQQRANNFAYTYHAQPLTSIHLESNLRYDFSTNGSLQQVYVFGTVGFLILLLACINYMNLATAYSMRRAREVGIKKTLGIMRGGLLLQFLAESALISLIALLGALVLFNLLLPGFERFTMTEFTPWGWPMVKFGLLLWVGMFLSAGLYPALALSRFKPVKVLKGSFSTSQEGRWLRRGLIVFQFTVTTFLLVAILVANRQLDFIGKTDLGFEREGVLFIPFRGLAPVQENYQAIKESLEGESYITKVAASQNSYLVMGLPNGITTVENTEGEFVSTSLYRMFVSYDFMETMGISLVEGRGFSRDIGTDTAQAVLVNEAAVRTFGWGTAANALGKRFGNADENKVVVGVVRDFHFESLKMQVQPVWIHLLQGAAFDGIVVRYQPEELDRVRRKLADTWGALVPEVPLDYTFLEDDLDRQYLAENKFLSVFFCLSIISALIACLGLFGMAAYVAQQRLKELGIRKVLGASLNQLLVMLSRELITLVIIAAILAVPLSWYVMKQWLGGFAYAIAFPWWAPILAALLATAIACFTVWHHAYRAARINPTSLLRLE